MIFASQPLLPLYPLGGTDSIATAKVRAHTELEAIQVTEESDSEIPWIELRDLKV